MKRSDLKVGEVYAVKNGWEPEPKRARLLAFDRTVRRSKWATDVPYIGNNRNEHLFVVVDDEGEPIAPVPEGATSTGPCRMERGKDRHMVSVRSRDVLAAWSDWLVQKAEADKAKAEEQRRVFREENAFRREAQAAEVMLGSAVGKRVLKGAVVSAGWPSRSYSNGRSGRVSVGSREATVLVALLVECLPVDMVLGLPKEIDDRRAALDAWVDDDTGKVAMPTWLAVETEVQTILKETEDGD